MISLSLALRLLLTLAILINIEVVSGSLNVEGYSVSSDMGSIDFTWSKFEYAYNNSTVEKTIWYKDYNTTFSNISDFEDYSEANFYFKTYLNKSEIETSRYIRQSADSPFIEIETILVSNKSLLSAEPNFRISDVSGNSFIFPDESKIIPSNEKGEKWVKVVNNLTNDNYFILFDEKNKKELILIFDSNIQYATSLEKDNRWENIFISKKFENIVSGKKYSFKIWITQINVSDTDIINNAKLTAADLSAEALIKPSIIFENKSRGYNYWIHEVHYKFDFIENEWGINPFKKSPHDQNGTIINNTCLATIYYPEDAISYNGPNGYPVFFNSTGESAIGLYFKDSITGPRKNDSWFYNKSSGGGFYLKKFNNSDDIVILYFITPAEPMIESYPVEIPWLGQEESFKLIMVDESYFELSKMVFYVAVIILSATLIISLHAFFMRKYN